MYYYITSIVIEYDCSGSLGQVAKGGVLRSNALGPVISICSAFVAKDSLRELFPEAQNLSDELFLLAGHSTGKAIITSLYCGKL